MNDRKKIPKFRSKKKKEKGGEGIWLTFVTLDKILSPKFHFFFSHCYARSMGINLTSGPGLVELWNFGDFGA